MRLALISALLMALTVPALADQTVDLPGGVPTPIPGTALTLVVSDITDQRCPAGVACVWEGMIRAEITVLTGTRTATTFVLCNACDGHDRSAMIAGTTFTLSALSPSTDVIAVLSRTADLEIYTLRLTVSP